MLTFQAGEAVNMSLNRSVLGLLLFSFLLPGCGGPHQGVSKDEIKIGTWAPLTGPASALADIAKGMEAYLASVNAQGGVHGRKITLIVKDDGYDPTRTPALVKELVEQDDVFAIVGGIGTANGVAVKDYLMQKGIPWIGPGSASRVWTIPLQGNIFAIIPSYVTEGRVLSGYAVKDLQAKKVGLFYQDDGFGREGQEGVRLGMGSAYSTVVAAPYKVADEDFSETAKKFKESGVDAVILFSLPQRAGLLVQEFAKIDYKPKILANQALADPAMSRLAGPGWEGAIVASGVLNPSSDDPQVERARGILKEHAPELSLGTYVLEGMGWAEILVQGLEKAGPELNRVKLIYTMEAFESTDNFFGRPVGFSKDSHDGLTAVRLMKVEGGKLVDLSDWIEP
jgi:ABC-type branched-subunit amino acid transport system substrate-binding protein